MPLPACLRSSFAVVASLFAVPLAAQAKLPPKGNVRLVGRIVTVLQESVPAAEVWVTDRAGTKLGRTIADGDGYFQVPQLPPTAATVHASAERMATGWLPIEAQGLVRAATLMLEDADPLHGTLVMADGTPAAHAAVLVCAAERLEPPFDWFAETTTDAKGAWTLPGAPLRPLLVRAFVPERALIEQRIERNRAGSVDMTFASAVIKPRQVRVQDPTGTAKVTVESVIGPVYGQQPHRWPTPAVRVACDASGLATLWPLPVSHEVRLRVVDFACMPLAIPCKAGEASDQTFALTLLAPEAIAPVTRIRGVLLDELGAPLAGVEVVAKESDRIGAPTTSGADGTFVLEVPARPGVLCHVAVRSPQRVLAGRDMEVTADGVPWQRMRVTPEETLQLAAAPAGEIRDTLHLPNGTPFAAARVQIGAVETATDAGGRLAIAGLPEGRHVLLVSNSTWAGRIEVQIVAGKVARVDPLTFAAAGEVFGVVTDANGQPAPGIQVLVQTDRQQKRVRGLGLRVASFNNKPTLTDRRGRYRITQLAEGDWAFLPHDGTLDPRKQPLPTPQNIHNGARLKVDLSIEQ